MDTTEQIERAVFDFVETHNAPPLFGRRLKLEYGTDLNEDMRMDPLDAYDLLIEFTEKFGIDPSVITFSDYFPENFSRVHLPLTIELLVDSAQAGRWKGN